MQALPSIAQNTTRPTSFRLFFYFLFFDNDLKFFTCDKRECVCLQDKRLKFQSETKMCVGWPEWIIYDQTHPVSTIQFVSRFFF